MADKNKYSESLTKSNKQVEGLDKRLYDTIFAEVGGGPADEVAAVASVYFNRIKKQGLEKALKGSSAYRRGSDQYKKAAKGNLNPYESLIYKRNKMIMDELQANPELIQDFWFHENVNAFGEPPWLSETENPEDIGRQRFYRKKGGF